MSNDNQFFNIITSGFGSLFRARIVDPKSGKKRGEKFVAVNIALLEGPTDNPEPMFVDLNVYDEEMKDLLIQNMDAINSKETKVSAAVELGSLYVNPFLYEKGDRAGQPGASLKARLLKIKYLKVGDQIVVSKQQSHSNQDAAAPAEPQPEIIQLDATAPDYNARVVELAQQGYVWSKEDAGFRKAS